MVKRSVEDISKDNHSLRDSAFDETILNSKSDLNKKRKRNFSPVVSKVCYAFRFCSYIKHLTRWSFSFYNTLLFLFIVRKNI